MSINGNKNDNKSNKNETYTLQKKFVKYPFSGKSSYLIDKFLVLGYEQKVVETTLYASELQKVNIKNNNLKYAEFQERPTIMNEICSDYKKESQENDVLLQIIVPNYPKLFFYEKIYKEKEQLDINEELINSIIISINPQDNDGNKKSFNGYGYTFYIKKDHRNEQGEILGTLYIPMTYVILSEYPFFFQFYKICKHIHSQMMNKTDEIPIDIILYNAIKYCPSPLNINLNLSFGIKLYGNAKNKMSRDDILNHLISTNKAENKNSIPNIFFNQLSGYPIMDFNLSFLFSLLEPKMVILTFIFTFLEYDIIFFSAEPEILNIVMYIFNNLNYPFNESIYYWHVVSLSPQDFMSNGESPFVGKVSSSMMGICCQYDPELKTTDKIKSHFVLNIDDKTLSFSSSDNSDQEENDKIMELYDYLNECIPEIDVQENTKEKNNIEEQNKNNYNNDELNLNNSVKNLATILNRRARLVTKTNYNEMRYRPSFFVPYEGESEMDMLRENLQIQKAFYNFIIQIVSIYIQDINIESFSNDDIKNNPNKIDKKLPIMMNLKKKTPKDQNETDSGEKSKAYRVVLTFKKLFKESSKYSTFLINFCQYHDCSNALQLPFSFFNEYLYFSKISPEFYLNAVDIFLIIDQFYGKIKKIDFIELIKEKQSDEQSSEKFFKQSIENEKIRGLNDFRYIYTFSYDEFELLYKAQLRAYINREQEDDKITFIKEQSASKQFRTYKRNNFLFSQKILDIYMHFSNNNFQQLQKCFKLIECGDKLTKAKTQIIENKIVNKKGHEELLNDFVILEGKKIDNEIDIKNITEENNKISSKYELMEISDIIEKHLIMEKYFSSYEIMKFSLLNIIAITMGLKKKLINVKLVIKVICDFCSVTKTLARKYMNTYLIIFTRMKLNKELDKKICDDCIKLIISYFKTTNTFPTEDTNIPIIISEAYDSYDDVQVEYKSLEEFKKCKKPDREKRAEFYAKSNKINEVELIDYIEKVFAGWYYIGKNKLAPNIKNYAKKYSNLYSALKINKSGDFVPKTPLELYASTNKLLFEFLSKFHIEENKYGEIGAMILSLLYYFKMEFFLPKWYFKAGNVNSCENTETSKYINYGNTELIKKLVVDIKYILLDLYEAILAHIPK